MNINNNFNTNFRVTIRKYCWFISFYRMTVFKVIMVLIRTIKIKQIFISFIYI